MGSYHGNENRWCAPHFLSYIDASIGDLNDNTHADNLPTHSLSEYAPTNDFSLFGGSKSSRLALRIYQVSSRTVQAQRMVKGMVSIVRHLYNLYSTYNISKGFKGVQLAL